MAPPGFLAYLERIDDLDRQALNQADRAAQSASPEGNGGSQCPDFDGS
jgi:hypothetical protein